MRISWRNSRRALISAVVSVAFPFVLRATPVNQVDVFFTTGGSYTAGVSTNTSGTLFVDCFINPGANPPNQVETVTFSLLQNGQPVSGGMSALSFNTVVGNVGPYLGSSNVQPFTMFSAGTNLQLKATTSNGASGLSGVFTVSTGTASKLVLLAPGLTLDQGHNPAGFTGHSGTAVNQQPQQTFAVTVVKTDVAFNQVATAGPVVSLASTDLVTFSPTSASLVNGQATFNVTVGDSQKTVTVTATGAGLSPGSVDIPVGGPEPERVFPFPSPFNPSRDGRMFFRVVLNDPKSITLLVKDRFGQDAWDGRNENGNIVAAGVYDVLLKVGTAIKSKKRFGVVK